MLMGSIIKLSLQQALAHSKCILLTKRRTVYYKFDFFFFHVRYIWPGFKVSPLWKDLETYSFNISFFSGNQALKCILCSCTKSVKLNMKSLAT